MADNANVIAVLGRNRRAGRWKVAGHTLVVAAFGACYLDLTRAVVDEEDEDISMSVFVLFGSVSFLFPQGSMIRPSGMALLSSASVDMPLVDEVTDLVPVDLSWTALFSRIRVVEKPTESRRTPLPQPPLGASDRAQPHEELDTNAVQAAEPVPVTEPVG